MRVALLLLLTLVTACRRPTGRVTSSPGNVPEPTPTEIADYSRYVRQGVGFLALGNEPFWSLTIQPDRQLAFRTPTDSLIVPVLAERRSRTGGRTYDAKTELGELHMQIEPVRFTDSMSGKVFENTVDVQVKRAAEAVKTYKGGGTDLNQLLLLNDSWVLTSLQGEVIKPAAAQTMLPQLEIQLNNGRVIGTDGCNSLSGQVRADNRYVAFSQVRSTRMACPGNGDTQARFLTALQKPFAYRVDTGTLTLSCDGQPIMTFKRTH